MLLIHQIVMHLQDPDNRHTADKATAAAARQRIQSIFGNKKEADDDDNRIVYAPYNSMDALRDNHYLSGM